MKVYLMGTGNIYKQYKHLFNKFDIVGLVDNADEKEGTIIDELRVYKPENIVGTSYDFIFLCSLYCEEMRSQLLKLGVPSEKIIDRYNLSFFEGLEVNEQYCFPKQEGKKKVILFSHALDLTGAPVVLCRLAVMLNDMGYSVTVVAEKNSKVEDKYLLMELIKNRISVVLTSAYFMLDIKKYAEEYDFYWVNTILLADIVSQLIKFNKPVLWWLHETEDSYAAVNPEIKKMVSDNLYVLSGGYIPAETYKKYSGHDVYKEFLYGIPDSRRTANKSSTAFIFGIVAAYSKRKGIEVILKAIGENEARWSDNVFFCFVGAIPEEIKNKYENIKNIQFIGELNSEDIQDFYASLDVLIAPSLLDSMPVVVTEAMKNEKMCIVTNKVGQSKYITNYVDGLVIEAGSVDQLENAIDWSINNKEQVKNIGKMSRKIYDKQFSMNSFRNNIVCILEEVMKERV